MTKLAIIPFTVAVQQLFYAKSFTLGVKVTLGILLVARRLAFPLHGLLSPPLSRAWLWPP
jgi:hypothetical protein